MALASGLGLSRPELGPRFSLISYLPTATAALVVVLVLAAGAPAASPSWSRALQQARAMDVGDVALLVVVVTLLAVMLQPLQLRLVRLLEGYWGGGRVAGLLGHVLLTRQGRRREALVERARVEPKPDGSPGTPPADVVAAQEALTARFPSAELLLPTALGNALRAFEERAGRPYGLDVVVIWPRLYPLLPDPVRAVVDDLRDQLDVSARISATAIVVAAVTAALLWGDGWWLLVPAGALGVGRIAYGGAVSAAVAYGQGVRVAVDLHRFDLLRSLHLPLPVDREAERDANRALCDFLRQGVPIPLKYEHPE
jgi:hypothetical protein